ncbi:MAG: SDR family NAD(P)-dependent oxidoreductase [Acidobacteriota bacterium]|nr:SDR family NAD(P)-dependent oxidoreductase [Acidobacteriota bacterium]
MSDDAVRKAVVTGASSGIGAAVCARLIADGLEVVGVSRRGHAELEQSSAFRHVSLDLGDLDSLPTQAEKLATEHADAAVVVLCAGRGDFGSLEEFSYDAIRSLVELDFLSHAYLCRAFVPRMKRKRGGLVVFIGSEAAHRGTQKGAVYCASKFALRGFAQALREEVSSRGVRVSFVSPAMTRTPFFDDLDFEPGPGADNALDPASVADAVAAVVAQPPTAVVDEIRMSPLKRVVRKSAAPRGGAES